MNDFVDHASNCDDIKEKNPSNCDDIKEKNPSNCDDIKEENDIGTSAHGSQTEVPRKDDSSLLLSCVESAITSAEFDDSGSSWWETTTETTTTTETNEDTTTCSTSTNIQIKKNRLMLTRNVLLGRDPQRQILVNALKRVQQGRSEAVLVHGTSGSGKSALVDSSLRNISVSSGTYFGTGKYSPLSTLLPPFAGVLEAFSDVVDQMLQSPDIEQTRMKMTDALKDDIEVLSALISSLSLLFGDVVATKPSQQEGKESKTWSQAFSQFKSRCRKFVRALTDIHPVVLFIDDLQWAEEESIELIKFLMTDSKSNRLLVVCTFRDEAVTQTTTAFQEFVEEFCGGTDVRQGSCGERSQMQNQHHKIPVSSIHLENLKMDDVTHWLSVAMELPFDKVGGLGEIAYRKTGGHPYSLVQYLRLLQDTGYVRYCGHSQTWICDINRIRFDTKVDESSVLDAMLLERLRRLPPEALEILKISSCVGSAISCDFLKDLTLRIWKAESTTNNETSWSERRFIQLIVVVISEGLLERNNRAIQSHHPRSSDPGVGVQKAEISAIPHHRLGSFKERAFWAKWRSVTLQFSHDKIQECLYKLVQGEAGRAEMLHLQIGRVMKEKPEMRKNKLFLVADQLYRGSCGMKYDEKMELVSILNNVGKDSMSKGAVTQSLTYLRRALDLIDPERSWNTHYSLTLKLHQHLAESESLTGNFEEAQKHIDTAVHHSKHVEDTVGSYSIAIDSLGLQGKLEEALQLALRVLEENLGEKFPKKPQMHHIVWRTMRAMMLANGNTDKILSLPEISDGRQLATMDLLHMATLLAIFRGSIAHIPLLVSRMVQFTLRHGRCENCPFGTWGIILSMLGKTASAYDFGRLALELVHDSATNDSKSFVLSEVYVFLMHWKEPVVASSGPLWDVYIAGIRSGHLQTALPCGFESTSAGFCAGLPLNELEIKIQRICLEMAEFGQQSHLIRATPLWQAIHCFMGRCPNPVVLSGDVMELEEAIQCAKESMNAPALSNIYVNAARLALFFHDWDRVMTLLARHREDNESGSKNLCIHFLCAEYIFMEGFVALMNGKHREIKKVIRMFRRWLKDGKSECSPFLAILLAEKWSLARGHELVKSGAPHDKNRKWWSPSFLQQPTTTPTSNEENNDSHFETTKELFDAAIDAARAASFLHYEAFATERAGRNLFRMGQHVLASEYFSKAKRQYSEWGATAKVTHMNDISL